MMNRLKQGEFTHLLVWKIDRISRNLKDFTEMYELLKDYKVTFVSKNEQFDTSPAMGEAMLKIILIFAELERKLTAEKVTSIMLSRAENGLWNGTPLPLGYKISESKSAIVPDDTESITIQLIFDLYEELKSTTALIKRLNEGGIIKCAACSNTFLASSDRSRSDGYRPSIYRCKGKSQYLGCDAKLISEIILGPFLLQYLSNLLKLNLKNDATLNIRTIEIHLINNVHNKLIAIDNETLLQIQSSIRNTIPTMVYAGEENKASKSVPVNNQKLSGQKDTITRALTRLDDLYLFSEESISKKDYVIKKTELKSQLVEISKQIENTHEDNGYKINSDYSFLLLSKNLIIINILVPTMILITR